MNPDTLCMGCMYNREGAEVCTHCHYSYGTPADTPLVLHPCTRLTSNYLVGRKLGQGGFGITYIGYDFAAKRRVAIKEYFPREISTRAEDRHTVSPISRESKNDLDYGLGKFEEEAHALAQFKDHPGIVSFFDFFKANGTGYIVMAYVEGDTLRKHLQDRGEQISFDAALRVLSQVMNALEEIHRVHILHRDISPENIYIERNGNAILLDFGAAKQAFGEQSQSFSLVLKPGYAPEEQYRRKGRQGPYTDIYALGATFYRSITGKIPTESIDRLHHDDLEPPTKLGVSMPARSEAALLKALAVRAENRHQSALEFRNAITPGSPGRKTASQIRPVVLHKQGLIAGLIASFAILFGLNLAGDSYALWETFPLLVVFVLMLLLFQRMWKSIQDGHARTAPDKALAFCFLPLFNLYWAFPVMWGFAVDYNRYIDRHSLKHNKLPEGTFLAATIAYVATCFIAPFSRPFFGGLILVNGGLLCIAVAKACDAVNALGPASPAKMRNPITDPPARTLFLYGVAGQYQEQQLEVNQQPITIGRNATRSNLVITSDEISGAHVKVWRDPSSVGVWVEDLNSMNGTFYRKAASDRSAGWTRLSGTIQLAPGDSFQLSGGKAVFEVRG
jgi:hypothetical protein